MFVLNGSQPDVTNLGMSYSGVARLVPVGPLLVSPRLCFALLKLVEKDVLEERGSRIEDVARLLTGDD